VTIVGIGFFQMKISDSLTIFIIAIMLTAQLPFLPSMTYYVTPMVILDYFVKKRKVSLDK
tara:strand:- start:435 stop:614 length:180 start_codon:yes stop_codon:yes gene_type:complete